MISELRIRGLGVIEEAVVPFAPGFTVLTGETGAGKTMVLTGLGLVMGQRAEADLVRTGTERAEADGEWLLAAEEGAVLAEALDDAGVLVEPTVGGVALLLGRTVSANGRSRAFAGGRAVPASVLAELSEPLIAVHGQSDQLLLRDGRRQGELLDRFAGADVIGLRSEVAATFTTWRRVVDQRDDLLAHRQEREREAALLRHGIDEIAAVNPQDGEDATLKAQSAILAHATDLLEEIGAARAALLGDGDPDEPAVADLLAGIRRRLDRAATLDPTLAGARDDLDRLAGSVDLVAGQLSEYLRSLDADPAQQAAVEERRQRLGDLKRRYGPELADVLTWWSTAQATVDEVDGADERIDTLSAQAASLRATLLTQAQLLTAARRSAAERLGLQVTDELRALAMPDARVEVRVTSTDDPDEFSSNGADTVAMLLVPHAGSEPRPLGRGASGGELSRVMLAIEVVLAGVNQVPSFVFDEVDAGIGGRVAVEVGRRLARLSRTAQVIVVTHLPQVAAFADQHVVVTKDTHGTVTGASVTVVNGPARVRELVRMLSGLEDSSSGAEHAAELLALAEADRGSQS